MFGFSFIVPGIDVVLGLIVKLNGLILFPLRRTRTRPLPSFDFLFGIWLTTTAPKIGFRQQETFGECRSKNWINGAIMRWHSPDSAMPELAMRQRALVCVIHHEVPELRGKTQRRHTGMKESNSLQAKPLAVQNHQLRVNLT